MRLKAVGLLGVGLMALSVSVHAQSMYETYNGFTVSTNPVLPTVEAHPSLWFPSEEVEALKSKKDASGVASSIWNGIMSKVNSFKTKSASSQSVNDRPRMAKYCAFGWVMNGDTTARNKAIEALIIAYGNVPRTATSADFGGSYDEIYRATWLQNYCAAYDWVQEELTSKQDSTIRAKLIEETLLLRNNMVEGVRYAPRPHNHRSKPAYALGTAALTFSSDGRAEEWLQFALTQQNTVTKYMFSADGLYREGSHYNMYSLVNALPFLWHYKNVSGVDLFSVYQPMFEYPLMIRSKKGWMPNVEDGYIKPYPTHMAAKAYMSSETALHSSEPLSKLMQWNWFTTTIFDGNYTGATNDVTWDIDEYVTFDPTIPQVVPNFSPTLKMDNGQVVFRNNESFSQPVERYLLFHGVSESDNHQHPDLLSYILEYQGTILATDAGYGKDGFSDANRSWYLSAEAHNTVTINGAAPIDFSTNERPLDLHFISSPAGDFAEKKTKTGVTGGGIRRGILFPRKEYWVVYDIGTAHASVTYKLNIHGRGTMTRTGSQVTWTTPSPSDNYGLAARLHAFLLGSETVTINNRTGYTSLFKDQVAQSWVEASQVGDSVLFLHLLVPGPTTMVFPTVTDLSTDGVLAFSMADQGANSQFMVQGGNSLVTVGKSSTNATFAWFEFSGDSLLLGSVNDGTIIEWQGSRIFESDQPMTFVFDYSAPGFVDFYIDAVPQPSMVTAMPLWALATVEAIQLNRQPVSFTTLQDGSVRFVLSGSGHLRFHANATTSVERSEPEPIPEDVHILGNYPNPFNPTTRIRFTISRQGQTMLNVYNMVGQCVKTLFDDVISPGTHEYVWDGRDASGSEVSTGIYFFEVVSNGKVDRKKGLLLK
ncbi:MAG: heparinase II/III family protein [Bacteroidota bacterium]